MTDRQYTIILDPDEEEGGGYLEALAKDGQPIPEEHQHPQALTISVAA